MMVYTIKATAISNQDAVISVKQSQIAFDTTSKTTEQLSNPAELFLGSFSSCILKNLERSSEMMNFTYSKAVIVVKATRLDKPPPMEDITYELTIYSNDAKLNLELLKKNIEKFDTIYNTVKLSCLISGNITVLENV